MIVRRFARRIKTILFSLAIKVASIDRCTSTARYGGHFGSNYLPEALSRHAFPCVGDISKETMLRLLNSSFKTISNEHVLLILPAY